MPIEFRNAQDVINWLDANEPEWWKDLTAAKIHYAGGPFTAIFGDFGIAMERIHGSERYGTGHNDEWFKNQNYLVEIAEKRRDEGSNYLPGKETAKIVYGSEVKLGDMIFVSAAFTSSPEANFNTFRKVIALEYTSDGRIRMTPEMMNDEPRPLYEYSHPRGLVIVKA